MAHSARYRVKPRRRREGRTDYRKRLALLKSGKPRAVVRKSLKHIRIQIVEYKEGGDNIIASGFSKELVSKYNWKHSTSSTPAAYLTGLMAGKKAIKQGVSECILDIGRYPPVTGSKVFACQKGLIDAGLKCPFSEKKIPNEDRLIGKHLDEKNINTDLEKIKEKILGGKE
jgi:large subunit ribosomal protein L18